MSLRFQVWFTSFQIFGWPVDGRSHEAKNETLFRFCVGLKNWPFFLIRGYFHVKNRTGAFTEGKRFPPTSKHTSRYAILDWITNIAHALPVPVFQESDFIPKRVVVHVNTPLFVEVENSEQIFTRITSDAILTLLLPQIHPEYFVVRFRSCMRIALTRAL